MRLENIRIALKAIRSQMLRTVLTILIIAFGIMALVGILTSIDALTAKINSDFSSMGVNTFSIQSRSHFGDVQDGKKRKIYPIIDYQDAMTFKERYDYPAKVSVSANATWIATIKRGSLKTNPNVRVIGGDESYLDVSGTSLEIGRNFSQNELNEGYNVALVGQDILKKLDMEPDESLGKEIQLFGDKYRIIGVLESKGGNFGFNNDNQVILPLQNVKLNLTGGNTRFIPSVSTDKPDQLEGATEAAIGVMRVVRGDRAGEEHSFEIRKSDGTAEDLIENLSFISIAATIIGIITLMGAAIGLMNIMLVSVTERTKEIGVRKSIGASSQVIRWQFLVEAIVIGQLGGLLGMILGIAAGNGIAILVGASFIIPWNWIIMAAFVCLAVSVISGFYPANKAAGLDPIEALRHE